MKKVHSFELDFIFSQIELVESDGLSILTATLAWDESSLCAYEEAFDVVIYLIKGIHIEI